MNFGSDYMYESLMEWLKKDHPEIYKVWEIKVRDAVDWMDVKQLE